MICQIFCLCILIIIIYATAGITIAVLKIFYLGWRQSCLTGQEVKISNHVAIASHAHYFAYMQKNLLFYSHCFMLEINQHYRNLYSVYVMYNSTLTLLLNIWSFSKKSKISQFNISILGAVLHKLIFCEGFSSINTYSIEQLCCFIPCCWPQSKYCLENLNDFIKSEQAIFIDIIQFKCPSQLFFWWSLIHHMDSHEKLYKGHESTLACVKSLENMLTKLITNLVTKESVEKMDKLLNGHGFWFTSFGEYLVPGLYSCLIITSVL